MKHGITLTSMPQLDEGFLALPLRALSDAALSKAKELGCSHAEVRVERLRQAYRSFRDHVLETTADGQVLGLSVRVVHNGVWGFASDITISTDSAANLAERAVATAKVSRPLTSAARTFAPSRTKILADARAIPDPAPVMTATLPSSSPIESLLLVPFGLSCQSTGSKCRVGNRLSPWFRRERQQ